MRRRTYFRVCVFACTILLVVNIITGGRFDFNAHTAQRLILDARLASPISSPTQARQYYYDSKPKLEQRVWYIAANLHDSEDVLGSGWMHAVLATLVELTERRGDVAFVSIVEGASIDGTRALLGELRLALDLLGIDHSIVFSPRAHRTVTDDRIEYLAAIRNEAMLPLMISARVNATLPASVDVQLSGERLRGLVKQTVNDDWARVHVWFINDIYFQPADALALLSTPGGPYDAVCAMDFDDIFYDRWVTRDRFGRVISPFYPYFRDHRSKALLRSGAPIPVYACWNGMLVLNAEPFAREQLHFRANAAEQRCYHSECLLIMADMHARHRSAIVINPIVSVTYTRFDYYAQRYFWPLLFFIHDWRQADDEPNVDLAAKLSRNETLLLNSDIECGFLVTQESKERSSPG